MQIKCKFKTGCKFTLPIHTGQTENRYEQIKLMNFILSENNLANHNEPLLRVTVSFQLSPLVDEQRINVEKDTG